MSGFQNSALNNLHNEILFEMLSESLILSCKTLVSIHSRAKRKIKNNENIIRNYLYEERISAGVPQKKTRI